MTETPGIRKIDTVGGLDDVFSRSRMRPVWVFKHSVICGASAGALRRFRTFAALNATSVCDFVLVEIQNAPRVSNALAERTGVRHESPQVILLQDEQAVWHASHWVITAESLAAAAGAAA